MKRKLKVAFLVCFVPLLALIGGGEFKHVLVAFIGNAIYFLPTFTAIQNKKLNMKAIFTLNLLLGWSIVGWIVSLVWATTKDVPTPSK